MRKFIKKIRYTTVGTISLGTLTSYVLEMSKKK